LKQQIADLRLENTDLRSKVHVGTAAGAGPSQERRADVGEQAEGTEL
jgi:hypothetical protein